MKYFVKWACSGNVVEDKEAHMKEVWRQIDYIEKSGKMKDGGPLLGTKGGYFVFEVDKASDILGLLGKAFLEGFDVEIHPVLSFKELRDYMYEEYKMAA